MNSTHSIHGVISVSIGAITKTAVGGFYRDVALMGKDGYCTITLFADAADDLLTPEEKKAAEEQRRQDAAMDEEERVAAEIASYQPGSPEDCERVREMGGLTEQGKAAAADGKLPF